MTFFNLNILLSISLLGFSGSADAEKYVLCGADEDGCYRDVYAWCSCIPFDQFNGDQSYCLDFEEMRCHPLSMIPACPRSFIFKNQASCLGMIFQSESIPGCKITTDTFCERHNMNICDLDGYPGSCKKSALLPSSK